MYVNNVSLFVPITCVIVYLHDEKENEDDEDADFWMEPGGREAQARFQGGVPDFCPGEIIKQGVDTLSRHQLHKEKWQVFKFWKKARSSTQAI